MVELSPVQRATVDMARRYEAILLNHRDEALWSWYDNPNVDRDNLLWLCQTIIAEAHTLPIDKMSRWLGFVQGQIIACGNASVITERNISRPIFHQAYVEAGIPIPPTRERPKGLDYREIVELVSEYLRRYPDERDQHHGLMKQIECERSHILRRSNTHGHITTSAMIFNEAQTHVFLVLHKAYDIWLCPGGHFEEDETLVDSALREAREETGIIAKPLRLADSASGSSLISIDSHHVPARPDKNEPPHTHHDFMFACTVENSTKPLLQFDEVTEGRWVPVDELYQIDSNQIARVLPKISRILEKVA